MPARAHPASAGEAGDEVVIRVSDTGPGIAVEVLPHIFARFYRAEASRSNRSTGLGLAIARDLIERRDGTISVESEPGKGSVCTVSLPRAAP